MLTLRCGRVFLPVGPRIETLTPVHEGHLFFDAGGQADDLRHWGAAFVFGRAELDAVTSIIDELRTRNPAVCLPSGEIKGRDLSDGEILWLRQQLRGHYVVLWFNSYPEHDSNLMTGFWKQLEDFIAADASGTVGLFEPYVAALKAVNKHKLFSLIAHAQRLREVLVGDRIGRALAQLRLVADRENLPQAAQAASLVRLFLAATARSAGMRTGSIDELLQGSPDAGRVTVDLDGDSAAVAGLQLVDVMVQGVNRQLDGFPKGFLDPYT